MPILIDAAGAMPLRSGAPSRYRLAMNKLNATLLCANDCPADIFPGNLPERRGMGKRRIGRWFADQPDGVSDGQAAGFRRGSSSGFFKVCRELPGNAVRISREEEVFVVAAPAPCCLMPDLLRGVTANQRNRRHLSVYRAGSDDRPPAVAGGRSTTVRHAPEYRVASIGATSCDTQCRHAISGLQRTHASSINSPRRHSTRERPLRFRPNSRHTGRSPPGSMHVARSGSWSWRSGTRSASGTRSCRPSRGPGR